METTWTNETLRREFHLAEQKGVIKVAELMLTHKKCIPPHYFLGYLRQYVGSMKHTPQVDLTLDLINQLIYDPHYCRLLHSCLAQIYPQVVRSLFYQQLHSKLLRAKVFRKMWMPKLHPQLYLDLRLIISRQIGVKLDYFEQSDAIQHIAHYYKNHVKLSPQQIAGHLPQWTPHNSTINIHPSQNSLPVAQLALKMHTMSIDDSDIDQQVPLLEVSDIKSQSKSKIIPSAQNKRARDFSVETVDDEIALETMTKKIRVSDDNVEFQTSPNTTQQKLQTLDKCRSMMGMLTALSPYECKQCGQRFTHLSSRDEHQVNHVTDRLMEFKEKERWSKRGVPKPNMLQNSKQWSLANDLVPGSICLPFTQKDHATSSYDCLLCRKQIRFQFKDDHWQFLDAIRANPKQVRPVVEGQMRNELDERWENVPLVNEAGEISPYVLMHYHCYLVICQTYNCQQ